MRRSLFALSRSRLQILSPIDLGLRTTSIGSKVSRKTENVLQTASQSFIRNVRSTSSSASSAAGGGARAPETDEERMRREDAEEEERQPAGRR